MALFVLLISTNVGADSRQDEMGVGGLAEAGFNICLRRTLDHGKIIRSSKGL